MLPQARIASMSVDLLPLSEACERNKDPILRILAGTLASSRSVLEIGSGTGQHAIHFAAHLPHLTWQPTDTGEYLPILRERVARAGLANLLPPIELDVRAQPWPVSSVEAVFSANTLHIMDWAAVEKFFRGAGAVTEHGATLCVYGPFRYRSGFSASNAAFDRFLRERDPHSGVRDFEAVDSLARSQGFELLADHPMPANNQTLVWRKGLPAR
jgi:SAM-dependent methyltransferase